MKNGRYRIVAKGSNMSSEFPCVICGKYYGCQEAYFVLYAGDEELGDICYVCAKAEDKAKILLNQAKALEEEAKWLKHLAQQDLGPVPFEEFEKIRRDTLAAMGCSDYEAIL